MTERLTIAGPGPGVQVDVLEQRSEGNEGEGPVEFNCTWME